MHLYSFTGYPNCISRLVTFGVLLRSAGRWHQGNLQESQPSSWQEEPWRRARGWERARKQAPHTHSDEAQNEQPSHVGNPRWGFVFVFILGSAYLPLRCSARLTQDCWTLTVSNISRMRLLRGRSA